VVNIRRLKFSLKNALQGLRHTLFFHQNLRIHVAVAALVIILGWSFAISPIEWAVITAAIFFVLVAEMVNTSIEEVIDLVKIEHRQQSRIAKDVAAGMVLLAAIFAVVVGLIIFIPYLK